MNCPKCNTMNAPHASYCKNCGTQLALIPMMDEPVTTAGNSNKVVTLMLIYFGVISFQTIFYLCINKWLWARGSSNYSSDLGVFLTSVSTVAGWLFSLGELVVLILLAASLKRTAQVWMIVFIAVQFISFIAWRLWPLFTGGSFRF